MQINALLIAFCALIAVSGCGPGASNSSPSGLPVVQMKIGDKEYYLEVADTDASREQGLMRRDSMPGDHGMIFVFPEERDLSFWMKNTRIPLFIIYLDDSGRVISTAHMKPYDETPIPSRGPARYAIELNDDQESASGIKAKQTLVIPALPSHPKP